MVTAVQAVVAVSTIDSIRTVLTEQVVISCSADKKVVVVVVVATVHGVIARVAKEPVIARAAIDGVVASMTATAVSACAGVHRIVA